MKPKVVVCGTRFGRVYLGAFRDPSFEFELAGIVGRGSSRTKACAEHYRVPLYTGIDEVPDDIDIACVVVSSGINGGAGADLAQRFLRRGVHVLQEHQLDASELSACLRAARESGTAYQLNTFYPNIDPVRGFIAAAREALSRRALLYIEASCSFPVMYSLLDILGKAIGRLRPWQLTPATVGDGRVDNPFRTVEGTLAGVPFLLRVQHQMDAGDPENHAHLFHRITLGTEGGSLMLVNTHGPVVWNPRPRLPAELDDTVEPNEATTDYLRLPSSTPIGPAEADSYLDIMDRMWPAGIRRAIRSLWESAETGTGVTVAGQYQLGVCALFKDARAAIGPLDLRRRAYYTPLAVASLAESARLSTLPTAVNGNSSTSSRRSGSL